MAIQAAGWQVVVSTSCIDRSASSALLQAGVLIARRTNIGLCLGAYRDLALLIHSIPSVHRQLKSLLLLNDSNLLLQSPEVLLVHLEKLSAQSSASCLMNLISQFYLVLPIPSSENCITCSRIFFMLIRPYCNINHGLNFG